MKEIGLFATTILTPDNAAPSSATTRSFSDTVQNYSTTPFRRVDRLPQLAHSVDSNAAMRPLKEALSRIPNVEKNERGPVLAVRPYIHTDHYWQGYFDTSKAISDAFGAAGLCSARGALPRRAGHGLARVVHAAWAAATDLAATRLRRAAHRRSSGRRASIAAQRVLVIPRGSRRDRRRRGSRRRR